MKPAPFRYQAAGSLAEAVAIVSGSAGEDEDIRLIAGGQSLGPMLNLRMVRPTLLVDIHSIDALRTISLLNDDRLRIGACVTHAQLEDAARDGPLSGIAGAFIRHVAGGIAYRAIRTRGTIGGSLAHADPAADWPCAMAALGAMIELAGPAGLRRVPATAFGLGMFETALQPGEIISAIELPETPVQGWGYRKHCRKAGEFAHALAACIDPGVRGDGRIEVWIGATGAAPVVIELDALQAHGPAMVPAQRLAKLRSALAARLPAWIAQGDTYARHLHAHVAAEAIIDAYPLEALST
jgi:carbon-monoxide dehydrogenase medium subunit